MSPDRICITLEISLETNAIVAMHVSGPYPAVIAFASYTLEYE